MGKVMMSGVAPNMTVPVTGIKGSDIAVGSIVKLMEGGVATEYLVVNQGIPSGSSLYDASCDGMWLLRKDIIALMKWDADTSNVLETSDIHAWLNGDMLAKFDSVTQNTIKQVKIPYRKNGGKNGSNQSGANGLPCKVFLLSGYEVGWTQNTNSCFPIDGACLSYFIGTKTTDSKRIGYLNGTKKEWGLRSMYTYNTTDVWLVNIDGGYGNMDLPTTLGIRPAFVLPSNAIFDKNTMILMGVA